MDVGDGQSATTSPDPGPGSLWAAGKEASYVSCFAPEGDDEDGSFSGCGSTRVARSMDGGPFRNCRRSLCGVGAIWGARPTGCACGLPGSTASGRGWSPGTSQGVVGATVAAPALELPGNRLLIQRQTCRAHRWSVGRFDFCRWDDHRHGRGHPRRNSMTDLPGRTPRIGRSNRAWVGASRQPVRVSYPVGGGERALHGARWRGWCDSA